MKERQEMHLARIATNISHKQVKRSVNRVKRLNKTKKFKPNF